ncbi:acyl-CoA dehydrogenase [Natronomonas pharaonis DSM 2160]|uniref:Acyl-CoA dehydrogenase n=1 Tax=Natronomonas pharaonis (strain ATCC 35678 / DSM 2160 / CIP 103997 / JCM 8858 / NBRC 14720 / NCIMB 2260 / Gabara) TaxID=348780 RepID=A0A1U7EWS7_NATPD|nr:acyl-CoA dehydrogenase family protein [Natronomonas pharaonis]CAI49558.1 acyl-CoA dehydrogenase [Natronomonas pharaonis DSM 2160]
MATDPIDYGALDEGRGCNYWELDPTLQFEAERIYPDDDFEWAEEVLSEFGDVLGHRMADTADRIDKEGHELCSFDKFGERRNEVEYHPLIEEQERITYEEFGVTHDAFHAPPGRDEPVGLSHTLMMQTLLSYVDAGFCCPVSMTTGAAIVLDKFDDGELSSYFEGLTARDLDTHIEGAMFLTEEQGGSDVGANETRAEPVEADDSVAAADIDRDRIYRLHGEKWFCSNIDAEGALALARTPGAPEGVDGLSLFLVPRTKPDGEVNEAHFRRLKDKLGTISVPTGEIQFEGAEAYLVGEEGRGFKYMSEMMNFERLTNATGALGVMGRGLLEAKVRAAQREAFGDAIDEYPLLRRDLVDMSVDYEAAAAFSFEAARTLDERERQGDDSDAYQLMRLFIPVAKYKTARMSVDMSSYAMEILGGNGYVREHTTERLLRDAQVLPIWEGPSNILALDVLRAFNREDAHEALVPYLQAKLDAVEHPALEPLAGTVEERFVELQNALASLATEDGDYAQYHAKRLADLVFDVVSGALLLEEAQEQIDADGNGRKALVATRFIETRFEDDEAYGVTSGERFAMDDETFAAIAKYASVEPETLVDAPTADD